jgi:hypothetical protein
MLKERLEPLISPPPVLGPRQTNESAPRRLVLALRLCLFAAILALGAVIGALGASWINKHNQAKQAKQEELAAAEVVSRPTVRFPDRHVERRPPRVPAPIHLDGKPADIRPLPYPFHTYLTINSDPDNMGGDDFEKIHALVNQDHGLNIGDQVFINCPPDFAQRSFFHLEMRGDEAVPVDLRRFHRFLAAYHRGWIDGIHGWSCQPHTTAETEFKLVVEKEQASRTIALKADDFDPKEVHFATFEYRLPTAGSVCRMQNGHQPLPVRPLGAASEGMDSNVAWTPAHARLPDRPGPELSFHLKGNRGAVLEVRNLVVTTFCRARAEAEARFLRNAGLGFLTYTEHGKPGHEFSLGNRFTLDGFRRPQFLGDDPRGAANSYFLDFTDSLGVVFLTAMHHCYEPKVRSIEEAVFPLRFNDGGVRYNLPRFLDYPREADGSTHVPRTNVQAERWLGFQIDKLLTRSLRLGEGGVIYTHWGCDNPKDTGLSPHTRQQLEVLKDAYYNISGKRVPRERVWVAPASEVALLARALHGIRANATYDEASKTVFIRSWLDPVSNQVIPASGTRCFGLANLTFYVRASASARVVIDGLEYTGFKRNPADLSGRESVTLVDDSVATTVLDEVDPLQRFAEVVTDGAEFYHRATGGRHGLHCAEISLTSTTGKAFLYFPTLTSADTTHLRFSYRKSNPKGRASIRIKLKDGAELTATEGTLNSAGWKIPSRADADWHDLVLDYTDLTQHATNFRTPRGAVERITLEATGKEGDQVFFDRVQFLRNPVHPPDPENRIMIAGTTEPAADGVEVVVEAGKERHTTRTREGYFFIASAAAKGSIVRVYAKPADGLRRYPRQGRALEADHNLVELVIPLADARDPRAGQALKRQNNCVNEMLPEGGLVYKPKSTYVSSGIGKVQEFRSSLQVNNLGFLDRDRRFENVDAARRIVCFGNCNLYGHSTPYARHTNILLEQALSRELGYPVEAVLLANSSVTFNQYWPYYQTFGVKFRPEVACIFLQSSEELVLGEPELLCEYREYDLAHLPNHMFQFADDGTLRELKPDPEYFQHVAQDPQRHARREAEIKAKGPFFVNGLQALTFLHVTDAETNPPAGRKALAHFKQVAAHYRDEFARNGTRLMIVLTPEIQIRYLGMKAEWTDEQGRRCRLDRFPKLIEAICRELKIGFVDTSKYIQDRYPDPAMCSWRYDNHLSAYGFEWMAEAVSEYLLATKFLKDLPASDPRELEDFQD